MTRYQWCISFSCSCPDSAAMCKHIAATLYGIGARLDAEPELLFGLRKVDAKELIARAGEADAVPQKAPRSGRILDSSKLADVFGIDVVSVVPRTPVKSAAAMPAAKGKKPSLPRKGEAAIVCPRASRARNRARLDEGKRRIRNGRFCPGTRT
jgi:hypothetical protein